MSDIEQAVKDKYGAIAAAVSAASAPAKVGCCGPTACGSGDPITSNLYSEVEAGALPAEAVAASLGCGNPTALLALEAGQTVLDLFRLRHAVIAEDAAQLGLGRVVGAILGAQSRDDLCVNERDDHLGVEQHPASGYLIRRLANDIVARPLDHFDRI